MAARAVQSVENVPDATVVEAEYDLEDILRQREEAVGGRDITFSFGGAVFNIPHPAFMTDEQAEDFEAATSSLDMALTLMGDDEYDRFRGFGGQASYIVALFQAVNAATQDADPQGRPTRSFPSSRAQRRAQRRR